jgi:hypothetical protein
VSFHHNLPLKVYGVDPRDNKEKLLDEAITGLSYELGSDGWFVYGGGRNYKVFGSRFYDEKEYPTFLPSNEEEEENNLKPNNYENIKIGELDSITSNVVDGVEAAVREVMKDELRPIRHELKVGFEELQENERVNKDLLEELNESGQRNHDVLFEEFQLSRIRT